VDEQVKHVTASIILLLVLSLSFLTLLPSVSQAKAGVPPTTVLVAKDGHPKWATDTRQDSNIVYYAGRTHIAYESSEGLGVSEPDPGPSGTGGYIKVITFDHATNQWLGPFRVSDKPVYDEHGYPVLAVDSSGYLHIVYDGHQIPLKYKRSLRPNDASAWTAAEQVGQIGTYPHLIVAPDNTLFLFYRERGSSYDRWVEQMQTKPNGSGSWSSPVTILDAQWKPNDPANDFAVLVQGVHLGQDGAMYMTWSWEPVQGTHDLDVGFAKSPDSGKTWTWANGTRYTLPIRRADSQERLWIGNYPSYGKTSISTNKNGQVVVLLQEYSDDWTNATIYQRVWTDKHWSDDIIARGVIFANVMIDTSGVARGLAMSESGGIMYMEARPPYTAWSLAPVESAASSFYPTVNVSQGGLFEGLWHVRVASDHSEIYWYITMNVVRRT
jgi:hypothetical protein